MPKQSASYLVSTSRHEISTKSLRHKKIKFEVADSFENASNADLTKDSFVNKLDKEIRSVLAAE